VGQSKRSLAIIAKDNYEVRVAVRSYLSHLTGLSCAGRKDVLELELHESLQWKREELRGKLEAFETPPQCKALLWVILNLVNESLKFSMPQSMI
jgi:hypothetical protein